MVTDEWVQARAEVAIETVKESESRGFSQSAATVLHPIIESLAIYPHRLEFGMTLSN